MYVYQDKGSKNTQSQHPAKKLPYKTQKSRIQDETPEVPEHSKQPAPT